YLHWLDAVRVSYPLGGLLRSLTSPQRKPGNEHDSILLAVVHHVVPLTICEAITILHRNDRHDLASAFDVLSGYIGQADQANLAFGLQLGQRTDRRFQRHDRIGNMELVNVYAIQA